MDSGVRTRRSRSGRSGGFTLGVGPWLLLLTVLGAGPDGTSYPDEFPLFPTLGNEGASGMAFLRQIWSPYGVSVDEHGRVEYGLTIEVRDLPDVEGESYHVWITTPELDPIVHLGAVDESGTATGTMSWHQLMVVVSREPADRAVDEGQRWNGPIVLRGFSAGARVTPLGNHSLFQQAPM